MDKRLSVLIKEIKKSSKTSSSSIVNLIKLELADGKNTDSLKNTKGGKAKIVNIATAKKKKAKAKSTKKTKAKARTKAKANSTKTVKKKSIETKQVDSVVESVDKVTIDKAGDIVETNAVTPIDVVKLDNLDTIENKPSSTAEVEDIVNTIDEQSVDEYKPIATTYNNPISRLIEEDIDVEKDADSEVVVSTGVSEELKRVAMTGMKLTKSTKARQKEYSKAKKAEEKKQKAKEKEAKEKAKLESEKVKDSEAKVETAVREINPDTPYGALTLSMDKLSEEMLRVKALIDEDMIAVKADLPYASYVDQEIEEEYDSESDKLSVETKDNTTQNLDIIEEKNEIKDATTIEDTLKEDISNVEVVSSGDNIVDNESQVDTIVEKAHDIVDDVADVENNATSDMSNTQTNNDKKVKETSVKAKQDDTYDIAKFVRYKGERKMDRAYDITKVNQYAKILNDVSDKAHEKKEEIRLRTESKTILKGNVKEAVSTAIELKPMRVLYVCSECQPFIATGGLADVAGSLPEAIKSTNPYADMRVIMPLYSDIKPEYREKMEYITNFTVHLAWRQLYCGIFKYVKNNVTYYFLDNEYYFKRKGSYGYFDDGERYAFFSKAVVEALPILDYFPHIMHCNDWQSALCSIYVKTGYYNDYRYANIKHIFTIHNIQYQGRFGKQLLVDLFGIDPRYTSDVEYDGDINLVKCAIQYSDYFTTVSPSYCDDLKQMEHSYGLFHEVRRQEYKLRGILNGIDYNFYSPKVDECIYTNYSIDSIDKKVENKLAIQKEYGLPKSPNTPLIVMATRLVSHKGLDLVSRIMDEVLKDDIQFMIVGTGDDKYIEYFKSLESRHPDKVKALVGQYSNPIARKLYAAGDLYIMPSKNEPCGLSQMISSIYGCVPIVRETGGLKDSIKDFGCESGGNGYTFKEYNAHDLLYSIRRAVADYRDRKEWKNKMRIVMNVDFSWSKPAKDYLTLYNNLV